MDPLLQQHHAAALAVSAHDEITAGESRKRTAPNGHVGGQRSKRNRYVSIACNECKRRKIRCNGQTPCERCSNLSLECVYAPNWGNSNLKEAPEVKDLQSQVTQLQGQVDTLWHALNALRTSLGQEPLQSVGWDPYELEPEQAPANGAPQVNILDPALTEDRRSGHEGGPTHALASMMPYAPAQQMHGSHHTLHDTHASSSGTAALPTSGDMSEINGLHPHKDPIWKIGLEKSQRLCKVYEDHLHPIYPLLDMQWVKLYAKRLFGFTKSAFSTGLMRGDSAGPDALSDVGTEVLKLVLAIAMIVEYGSASDDSKALYASVERNDGKRPDVEDSNGNVVRVITLNHIRIALLQSLFAFHNDEEEKASKLIHNAASLCREMGLNRFDSYTFSTCSEAEDAQAIFWNVYSLDRRWSTSRGVPFALPDAEIDNTLDSATLRAYSPYLGASTTLSRLSCRIPSMAASFFTARSTPPVPIDPATLSSLATSMAQLDNVIPESLRLDPSTLGTPQPHLTPGVKRQKLTCYLRVKSLRLCWGLYLLSNPPPPSSNIEVPQLQDLMCLAHDILAALHALLRSGELDKTNQILYSHFMPAAIGACLLPTVMFPETFKKPCQADVEKATELVQALGNGSKSVRLKIGRTVKALKGLASTRGGGSGGGGGGGGGGARGAAHENEQQDAALTMAGLATGRTVVKGSSGGSASGIDGEVQKLFESLGFNDADPGLGAAGAVDEVGPGFGQLIGDVL